jgi:hypothetical protein
MEWLKKLMGLSDVSTRNEVAKCAEWVANENVKGQNEIKQELNSVQKSVERAVSAAQSTKCSSASDVSDLRSQTSFIRGDVDSIKTSLGQIGQVQSTVDDLRRVVVPSEFKKMRDSLQPISPQVVARDIREAVIKALVAAGPAELLPDWAKACNVQVDQLRNELESVRRSAKENDESWRAKLAQQCTMAQEQLNKSNDEWTHKLEQSERKLIEACESAQRELQNERAAASAKLVATETASQAKIEQANAAAEGRIREVQDAHQRDLKEFEAQREERSRVHNDEIMGAVRKYDELSGKIWPEFLRADSIREIRERVEVGFHEGSPSAGLLYAELIKLSSVSGVPNSLADQAVNLGHAFYAWFNELSRESRSSYDEVVATWLTSLISGFGFTVSPVKPGERYNNTIHYSSNLNGDVVRTVKSFLFRNRAGVTSNYATVELG